MSKFSTKKTWMFSGPEKRRTSGRGGTSIYENHRIFGSSEFLDSLSKSVRHVAPEYAEEMDKYFNQANKHMFNMFIMKKELLNDYSKWLFSVLSDFEKRVEKSGRNMDRCCGFAGEHLLNIWVNYQAAENGIKTKALQMVFINCPDINPSFRKRLMAGTKKIFSYFFPYGRRRDIIKWTFFMYKK